MVKFARQCLQKLVPVVRRMESILGPDTGDLRMRVGIHSGPVTAGVLRGEKSRFQVSLLSYARVKLSHFGFHIVLCLSLLWHSYSVTQ